jgi:hypothetical protein
MLKVESENVKTCPACRGEIEPTSNGRFRCIRCHWICVIDRDGRAKSWLEFARAKPRRIRKRIFDGQRGARSR